MLKKYFSFDKYNTNYKTEILAGLTTFITLAYILILNPQILSDSYVIMGDGDMATKVYNGVFIGTCLGAFIGTFLCAIYAKVPFAQAPVHAIMDAYGTDMCRQPEGNEDEECKAVV